MAANCVRSAAPEDLAAVRSSRTKSYHPPILRVLMTGFWDSDIDGSSAMLPVGVLIRSFQLLDFQTAESIPGSRRLSWQSSPATGTAIQLQISTQLERQAAMQTYPERVPVAVTVAARPQRPVSDLVYEAMTLAAMLWLLASLWAF